MREAEMEEVHMRKAHLLEADMIIDCDACPVRGVRCSGCLVTALTALPLPSQRLHSPSVGTPGVGTPSDELALDADEQRSVRLFVEAGLIDRRYAGTLRARAEPAVWGARASG